MGVRYNAEKKRIGAYYSTPIYSFRCKCHLCDGWFEIQTDPKNTRYVVVSGARQKDEDWNPEENGGYAIHDTEKGNAGPSDPLAALEKSTDAQTHLTKVQMPRLESLLSVSEHYNSDPYALSLKVRKRFRQEKKVEKEKQAADDRIKGRYGLPETLRLVEEDDDIKSEAREGWRKGRKELEMRDRMKRHRLSLGTTMMPASSTLKVPRSRSMKTSNDVVTSFRTRILERTLQHSGTLNAAGDHSQLNVPK